MRVFYLLLSVVSLFELSHGFKYKTMSGAVLEFPPPEDQKGYYIEQMALDLMQLRLKVAAKLTQLGERAAKKKAQTSSSGSDSSRTLQSDGASRSLTQTLGPVGTDTMYMALRANNSVWAMGPKDEVKFRYTPGNFTVILNSNLWVKGNLTVGGTLFATSPTAGASQTNPGRSCLGIKQSFPGSVDGLYYIIPDGVNTIQVYCDMTRDGGGWTLFLKNWNGAAIAGRTAQMGSVLDGLSLRGGYYKLADSSIISITGCCGYSIMGDQNGYVVASSTGNREYIIIRNYTALWRYDAAVPNSLTTLTFQDYRLSDNALMVTFQIDCGFWAGYGINCDGSPSQVWAGINPQGGASCAQNLGLSGPNAAFHQVYMGYSGSPFDTEITICNGQQRSSQDNLNHRWWVRETAPLTAIAGLVSTNPGRTCLDIKTRFPAADTGIYWINPDPSAFTATQVWCNMQRDGGGWTLGIKQFVGSGVSGTVGALNTVHDSLTVKANSYKLADTMIRSIIRNQYSVMMDQTNYNTLSQTGNWEYLILRNYSSVFGMGTAIAESLTSTTSLESRDIRNHRLMWSGRLACGTMAGSGAGINCFGLISGVPLQNPQGGLGCNTPVATSYTPAGFGSASNVNFHTLYMGDSGGDSRMSVCNGDGYTSGYNLNHRIWFREVPQANMLGLTTNTPGVSCLSLKQLYPWARNGFYWVSPDPALMASFSVYCDMFRDGGGWTLGVKAWSGSGVAGNPATVGTIADAFAFRQNAYKLSDMQIRAITKNMYSVMGDQNGFTTGQTNANDEYVVLRNYSMPFTYSNLMWESITTTQTQSWQISTNLPAWTGRLACSQSPAAGFGINCKVVVQGTTPAGGAGCNLNLGTQGNVLWSNFYMSTDGSAPAFDTHLWMCNGQQSSSSGSFNHRFWFREVPISDMDGLLFSRPGRTCLDLKTRYPDAITGMYFINPDPSQSPWLTTPTQVLCEMSKDGGGYTFGLKTWFSAGIVGNANALGSIEYALTKKQSGYKLSDQFIRAVTGGTAYNVLIDQVNFYSVGSSINNQYAVIRNYTVPFTFVALMEESGFGNGLVGSWVESRRLSDNAQMWAGRLQCGFYWNYVFPTVTAPHGYGINCFGLTGVGLPAANPQGGSGCVNNLGIITNVNYHTIYMSDNTQNTFLDMCSGTQQSNAGDMNHRFWFRENVLGDMDGLVFSRPARSCLDLLTRFPYATTGNYWINPDASQFSSMNLACHMQRDGGGWTLGLKTWNGAGVIGNAGQFGTTDVGQHRTLRGTGFKLADLFINSLVRNMYSVMQDQIGWVPYAPNSAFGGNGNFEYNILRNYTQPFLFSGYMDDSLTLTTLASIRADTNVVMWQGRFLFNQRAGFGINGVNVVSCTICTAPGPTSTGPAGGAACINNAGITNPGNPGWHHWFMADASPGDSYAYMCNGAQSSSNTFVSGSPGGMNHRFWFREVPNMIPNETMGLLSSRPATTCLALKRACATCPTGWYWLNFGGAQAPAYAMCEMSRDGGGWTLGIKHFASSGLIGNTGDVGAIGTAMSWRQTGYKLSDAKINGITGLSFFNVMGDQNGFTASNSAGNFEYVILRNYSATFTFAGVTPESSTITTMQSYRISDNALAWTGRLQCGAIAGSFGINCYAVLTGINPSGGTGCAINLGTVANIAFHNFYMADAGAGNSFLSICNSEQRSDSGNFNHRWWFRGLN